MGRIYAAYALANRMTGDVQEGDTSTNTTDYKTITKPVGANACFISVKTTAARLSFDGTNPDSATNCLYIPAGTAPVFFPFATDIIFAADSAANSVLTVLWLE